MMISSVPSIQRDDQNIPVITGTTTKVIEVVLNQRAFNSSPEELQPDMPHLTVEQIRAALAYYEANREELDADTERRHRWAEEMRQKEIDPFRREELLARIKPAG